MEKNKELSPIDKLFDENNSDPIVLFDEKGEEVSFEQIALIPLEENIYAILKPMEKTEGVGEDEALVFEIVEGETEEDDDYLNLVSDMAIIDNVFKIYDKLIDEEEAKNKKDGNK